MSNFIKSLLRILSRIIYFIIPVEYRLLNLERKIKQELVEETYKNFKNHIKKSVCFKDFWSIREHAIKTAISNDKNNEYYYLEFGVWQGATANFFSKHAHKVYAFDSFEGLSEDWGGTDMAKGFFNLNGKPPKLNPNVEPVIGWVDDTLDDFLKKHNPKINFVHLDMDTYNPTKFTLQKIKPYLVKDAVILFDELYHYVGWDEGEYKALNEVFNEDEFKYHAFNINGKNASIQIK